MLAVGSPITADLMEGGSRKRKRELECGEFWWCVDGEWISFFLPTFEAWPPKNYLYLLRSLASHRIADHQPLPEPKGGKEIEKTEGFVS